MEKIWKWLKKYWGIIAAAVTAVAGFLIGRRFPPRPHHDITRIRDELDQLRKQLVRAAQSIDELERINGELADEVSELRGEISRAERAAGIAIQYSDSAGGDINCLWDIHGRLADLADRYRKTIAEDKNP